MESNFLAISPFDFNWTLNETYNLTFYEDYVEPLQLNGFTIVLFALYCLILLVGIVGNIGVCYSVYHLSERKKLNITYYFLANLAVSDILILVFSLPFIKILNLVCESWSLGTVVCSVAHYFQYCFILQKSFLMAAITCDRHHVITSPMKGRMRKRTAHFIVAVTYFSAAVIPLPSAIYSQVVHVSDGIRATGICTEIWPSDNSKLIFTFNMVLLHYILPLTLMCVLNMHIVYSILTKKTPGEADVKRDNRIAASKKKSVKILAAMVFIFAVSWLPLNIVSILDEIYTTNLDYNLWLLFHWLTFGNCVLNPVLYCLVNKKFKEGFKILLLKMICRPINYLERERSVTMSITNTRGCTEMTSMLNPPTHSS